MNKGAMEKEVSIKEFVRAMERSGLESDITYDWLRQYDGPGYYKRKSQGENRLGFAYNHNHSIDYLEAICDRSKVDRSRIDHALEEAQKASAKVETQGKTFRKIIPWEDVAAGAQAFIDSHGPYDADGGNDPGDRPSPENPRALETLSPEEGDEQPFDPANAADGRERVMRAIKARRGQSAFRQALLDAYDGRAQ